MTGGLRWCIVGGVCALARAFAIVEHWDGMATIRAEGEILPPIVKVGSTLACEPMAPRAAVSVREIRGAWVRFDYVPVAGMVKDAWLNPATSVWCHE